MYETKLLTIVVPSYNSKDYLNHCLDTLVDVGPELEVIVVDDGSNDNTADIARDYCRRYPDIVRLEQKANGGHGSAINRGLEVATGTYFKCVDSDDWIDIDAMKKVLTAMRESAPDMIVANYVYDYSYNSTVKVIRYRNAFSKGMDISWANMRRFRPDQLMLMHALYHRTALLRQCGVKLPEHTFYVDNIIAYQPLPFVKSLVYIDCTPYHYAIGRPDQSVNTQNMIKKIDQQLKVTRMMIEVYDVFREVENKKLRRYMVFYLSMMVAVSVLHIYIAEDKSIKFKADDLWLFIRERDEKLYAAIRRSLVNICIELAHKIGPRFIVKGHTIVKRIYKFS